jgi:hypothetical protein
MENNEGPKDNKEGLKDNEVKDGNGKVSDF